MRETDLSFAATFSVFFFRSAVPASFPEVKSEISFQRQLSQQLRGIQLTQSLQSGIIDDAPI